MPYSATPTFRNPLLKILDPPLWRAQAWPLDSIRLLAPFYTPILSPPTTPHPPPLLLPPVILLPARKKLPTTGQILGIRNLYTHTVIASK